MLQGHWVQCKVLITQMHFTSGLLQDARLEIMAISLRSAPHGFVQGVRLAVERVRFRINAIPMLITLLLVVRVVVTSLIMGEAFAYPYGLSLFCCGQTG